MLDAVRKALLDERQRDLDFPRLDREAFAACPSDSIDYAVMEKTARRGRGAARSGWSDVGSWARCWEHRREGRRRQRGARRRATCAMPSGCYVRSREPAGRGVGLEDVVVVETDDARAGRRQRARPGREGVVAQPQGARRAPSTSRTATCTAPGAATTASTPASVSR